MRKKISALLVIGCLLTTSMVPTKAEPRMINEEVASYALPTVSLYVNKQKVDTAVAPVQQDGRILVPIREVFEAMNASVHWDNTKKAVTIKYKNTIVVLTLNDKVALVNGTEKVLDVPAQNINGKIMIPVRFVSEALGMSVHWKSDEYSVWINEPVETTPDNGSSNTTGSYIYTGNSNNHQLSIQAGSYGQTKVTNVALNESNNKVTVTVSASSAISDVGISLITDRVIIDVKNSLSGLANSITPSSNTYVKSIRTSQFTSDTSRIVLDLKSSGLVKASLSSDRTKLSIELSQESLEELRIIKEAGQDKVFIKGVESTQMTITENAGSKQIQFVLPNLKISKSIQWEDVNGTVMDSLHVVQSGNNLVGTIKLKENANVETNSITEGTYLILTKATSSGSTSNGGTTSGSGSSNQGPSNGSTSGGSTSSGNTSNGTTTSPEMSYVSSKKPVINLTSITGLKANNIKITDNYRDRQIVFDLGKDYSSMLPNQTKTVNDGYVKNIVVATDGTTKITINANRVYAYYIYSCENKIQIQLVPPSEKFDQIVVIDIGHGGSDAGAVANNLTEKEINFNQGMALYQLLNADSNFKVYLTRDTDRYPTLQFRAALANEIDADLFVSIHNNAASATVRGTETLYYPMATDTRGKKIAQLIQDAIVSSCNMQDRGIKPRTDLYVLRNTNMTAVLLETGFITNPEEAIKINSPSFISTWSKSVYAAIVKGFELL